MKPPEVLTRDRLLASYQVKPVLTKLRQTLLGAGVVLLTSAVLLGGLIQSGTDEDGVYGERDAIALHTLQQRYDLQAYCSSSPSRDGHMDEHHPLWWRDALRAASTTSRTMKVVGGHGSGSHVSAVHAAAQRQRKRDQLEPSCTPLLLGEACFTCPPCGVLWCAVQGAVQVSRCRARSLLMVFCLASV